MNYDYENGYSKGLRDGSKYLTLHYFQSEHEDLNELTRAEIYESIKLKLINELFELFRDYNDIIDNYRRRQIYKFNNPINVHALVLENKNKKEEYTHFYGEEEFPYELVRKDRALKKVEPPKVVAKPEWKSEELPETIQEMIYQVS